MPTRHYTRLLFAALALVLAGPPVVHGQSSGEADGWTPALHMRYHSVTETALSPDGRHVAYVEREPLMEGEQSEYRSQVWLVPADGSEEPVQYTRGEHSASGVAFSPDGRYLAFVSSRSGDGQVWAMRLAGGEAWQVTHAEAGVGAFRWAPDGDRIAYTMRDPETEEEKQRAREKRDVILVDQHYKYSHLYTVPFGVGEDTARTAQRLTGGDFHVTRFDWSPDGETIVFAHQADPRINTGFTESDLSTVPADSGAVTPLVTWPGADRDPRFAPDGQSVAFTSHGGEPQPVGLQDVFLVPAGGGEPRPLGPTPDRDASLLGWAEDGAAVMVAEAVRTSQHVFALPTDGSNPRRVTTGDGVYGAASFDRATRRMAFVYEDVDVPEDVYVSDLDGFERQRLTDVHRDVPRPPMGRTELLSWTSPDGTEVEGLLTYPVGYEEGEQVPLVLNVHGGPAGVYQRRFTGAPSVYMIQHFAQQGYAVLRPNPRGSVGYGRDFRFANVQDWGYGDYEDLMAGVDAVVARGVAHPDSLALMGWSYGGYMTSFAVTRTDRFKAASMGAGLPNLVSMVTTTDIPDYLVAHMDGELWEDFETYEKHSAIYRIAEVSTPTQVIHGAEDERVPTAQGREFYVALKRRGVPTELILYPRTPHGPREPKLLMDVTPRILDWFAQHLGREELPANEAAVRSSSR